MELVHPGTPSVRDVELHDGAVVRDAVHAAGLYTEATSALIDGRSVPLDRPLTGSERIQLVRTFSGG